MHLEQASTDTSTSLPFPSQSDTRLHGRGLVLARGAWFVVLALALGLYLVRIPLNFADQHVLCTTAACRGSGRLTLDKVQELQRLGLSMDFYIFLGLALSLLLVVGYLVIGVGIFWRKSDDRMALLASCALVTFGAGFTNATPVTPVPLWLQLVSVGMAFLGNSCLGLFVYLFPSGQFVPRWTRGLAVCWIAYWGFTDLVLASFITTSGLSAILFFSLLVSMVGIQVYRYRRVSAPTQRQQTKWVVWGLTLAFGGFSISLVLLTRFSQGILAGLVLGGLLYAFLLLIPLSIGVAILRSHLWDIDLLINRTLVYGALTAGVVGLNVLVAGSLGALVGTGGNVVISLLASGLAALLFQPLRTALQRGVNRLMYGQRDEPYAVVARLGQRLESTLAPEAVLPTIVETVAQALKLPYVAITLQQGAQWKTAAVYGAPVEAPLTLPLTYQSAAIGQLVLGPRRRGEALTPADQQLLADLARQIGLAAHAACLTVDLQRSRERLVTAREEERRRLRRDLHDGLGPTLSGLTLQVGAIRNLLPRDLAAADGLLGELSAEIAGAVGDIRRLVYDLRPPALDQLGLAGAIRVHAVQYSLDRGAEHLPGLSPGFPRLAVTVEAPEHLPRLPAAAEVAAYRIVLEALANVARHAQARTCCIRLAVAQALEVEISDDGIGLPGEHPTGVGLFSMRERAAELGGMCQIAAAPGGGTRVLVRLPLPEE